ncbi:matrixin family metalloprotease [Secundilactobacillus paracollinoides]|uniref:Peptidase M10 metallopeptidase domain-containing protein n=1 Tax=Secundilactobacillus paracollinoides TaxID=240427 RepID=A0A1B2IVC4_9LACO|nr:matrixin family metalloprotease [Secundilactobacillus paracollinoides]ANZ60196.1 hypothetical protein AYR61_01735 [Secundilactobacillus paracollinoides]ANZ65990.1 hypothetical protein AYR63_01755 [Secundilactobacillus paracollinoides]KRL77502.1 hypothetical protein FC17_GL001226 [Secundilactobacillus paracollinoides DSM 15502 = JCM 11969]
MNKWGAVTMVGLLLGGVGITAVNPQQATAAKTITTQAALNSAIKKGTDLKPSATILSQPASFYTRYKSSLTKNFNMSKKITTFHNHKTYVYVKSPSLKTYTTKAMATWNKVLGRKVFVAGTASKHDLVVTTKNAGTAWDGMNNGKTLTINSNRLNDANYLKNLGNSAKTRSLTTQYKNSLSKYSKLTNNKARVAYYSTVVKNYNALLAAKKSAAPTKTNYWSAIMVHELGHSLGLNHTPYLTDIMYAEKSNNGLTSAVNGKYAWSSAKDPKSTRLMKPAVSSRDVSRAKLGMKLGFW